MREARSRCIHEVESGSELASAVLDSRGNRLFREGAVLSEQQIAKLAEWGVKQVTVWENDDDPAVLAAARVAVDDRGVLALPVAVLGYRLGRLE